MEGLDALEAATYGAEAVSGQWDSDSCRSARTTLPRVSKCSLSLIDQQQWVENKLESNSGIIQSKADGNPCLWGCDINFLELGTMEERKNLENWSGGVVQDTILKEDYMADYSAEPAVAKGNMTSAPTLALVYRAGITSHKYAATSASSKSAIEQHTAFVEGPTWA